VSDEKIYDTYWRDAPEWAENAVRLNWPQKSSFRVRDVKEYDLGYYSVAVEHNEGGHRADRILSGPESDVGSTHAPCRPHRLSVVTRKALETSSIANLPSSRYL
jgi:hypothetical protein